MIFDAIDDTSKRIQAPFWGGFFLSWAIWNIDVALRLGSSDSWKDKAQFFRDEYSCLSFIVLPVLSSVVATLLGHGLKEGLTIVSRFISIKAENRTSKMEIVRGSANSEMPVKMALVASLVAEDFNIIHSQLDNYRSNLSTAITSTVSTLENEVANINKVLTERFKNNSDSGITTLKSHAGALVSASSQITTLIRDLSKKMTDVAKPAEKTMFPSLKSLQNIDYIEINQLLENSNEAFVQQRTEALKKHSRWLLRKDKSADVTSTT